MEETTNNQNISQPTDQEQPVQDKPKGLLPGQEHEDELDYMGGAMFSIAKNGFEWIKHFFVAKKAE